MNHFGDNDFEMPADDALEEEHIESLFRREDLAADDDVLRSFVSSVRAQSTEPPVPSTALLTIFSNGISTENGDLSATTASNVNGPAPQESGLPKWRQQMNKIPQAIAGLSVAAKVMFGAGVAMAATTGAGAAGVLPDSVQQVVAEAVESVTPFTLPHNDTPSEDAPVVDNGNGDDDGAITNPEAPLDEPASAPTPPTTSEAQPDEGQDPAAVTPPVESPESQEPDDDEAPSTDGQEPTPTPSAPATPTTEPGDNESHTIPTVVELTCSLDESIVTCDWSSVANIPNATYMLVRGSSTSNVGQVLWQGSLANGSFSDMHLVPETTYSYLVLVNAWNGHPADGRSNQVKVTVD